MGWGQKNLGLFLNCGWGLRVLKILVNKKTMSCIYDIFDISILFVHEHLENLSIFRKVLNHRGGLVGSAV